VKIPGHAVKEPANIEYKCKKFRSCDIIISYNNQISKPFMHLRLNVITNIKPLQRGTSVEQEPLYNNYNNSSQSKDPKLIDPPSLNFNLNNNRYNHKH
jgi:hypothetical protein